jgi:hypothetical protein
MGILVDLIGRQRELDHFETLISRGQPALVVVAGQPGTGKTGLLRAFGERAASKGWKTIPGEESWPMVVTPEMTDVDFREQILRGLGVLTEEGFTTEAMYPSAVQVGSYATEKAFKPTSTTALLNPIVKTCISMAPLAILIDGYRPNHRFEHWFSAIFLNDMLQSDASIITVIADVPKEVDRLTKLDGSVVFTTGTLKSKDIRERFRMMDAEFSLELEESELDYYVRVVREKPDRFHSLARLLELTQKSNPTSSFDPKE